MFKSPTVFVLGAGASIPYRFPSMEQLRKTICMWSAGDTNTQFKTDMEQKFRIARNEIQQFGNAFLRSQIHTIDEFLGRNDHFLDIGKLAISYALCGCENPDNIRRNDIDDNWYAALWNVLIRDISKADDLAYNDVKFITFNYDRSLEFFLHDATKNSFDINDAEAFRAWIRMKILHVYGSLGEFHYSPQDNTRPYSDNLSTENIRKAAAGIEIIPQARDDSEKFKIARTWFDEAVTICFLGFGFDALNVNRLGLADVVNTRKERGLSVPSVVASVYGRTAHEQTWIKTRIGGANLGLWEPINAKNLDVLRQSYILLPP